MKPWRRDGSGKHVTADSCADVPFQPELTPRSNLLNKDDGAKDLRLELVAALMESPLNLINSDPQQLFDACFSHLSQHLQPKLSAVS